MSLNIHYVKFATDYTDKLRSTGRRKKARAFWEYFYDVNDKEKNSVGFYAKSWEVSKSTAHEWLEHFKEEYELFTAAIELVNKYKNIHVKNQAERLPNDSRTNEHQIGTVSPCFNEVTRTNAERLPNKALNIDDGDMRSHKLFDDLFWIYSINTKFVGKKDTACYEAYLKVQNNVSHKDMSIAIMFYLHDEDRSGKYYNFINFLKNETYNTYIPKRIKILYEGEWLSGTYNSDSEVFTGDNGFKGRLDSKSLTKKFSNGELEFIREVAA